MPAFSNLKVYVAQIDVIAGQPSRNFETIAAHVDRAKKAGAHLIVFPEMCVAGYFLADTWTDTNFVAYAESFNDRIRALSSGIGIVWGNVGCSYAGASHAGHDGRPVRYNMAYFAYNGAWVPRVGGAYAGHYIKTLQPNYRVFDDDRYFCSSADDASYFADRMLERDYLAPFEFCVEGDTYRIGLQICEDLWSGDYAVDPTAFYVNAGCDAIVNISASPWTLGKETSRDKRIGEHVRNLGHIVPLVYVNAVGMQNTSKNVMGFDGGSTVYDAKGTRVFSLSDNFTEAGELIDWQPAAKPTSIDEPSPAEARTKQTAKLFCALTNTLRRFDNQVFSWKPTWVIGLSGGIDSSVTAALLAHAIGPERIVGYNLATRYNSDVTKANAYALAQTLGIRLVNGSIEQLVQATEDTLAQYGYAPDAVPNLARENVQARLRGHMLSTFAQVEGGVIMNNGNKVETLFGYATLYGDAIGALAPIGDVTKVRLFDLARYINEQHGCEVIPARLIPTETDEGLAWECPPSAELASGQVDPMKWFYHDWLVEQLTDYPGFGVERVMQDYAADRLQSSAVAKWVRYYGLANDPQAFIDDLEWVLRQMRNNVFKRIQAPPNIMVTRGAFGMDFRECQGVIECSESYNELRARILSLDE